MFGCRQTFLWQDANVDEIYQWLSGDQGEGDPRSIAYSAPIEAFCFLEIGRYGGKRRFEQKPCVEMWRLGGGATPLLRPSFQP